jgi:hypothetical protein
LDRRLLLFVSVALAVGLLVGSALTYAALQVSFSIPTSGSVFAVNVGVFSDSACTVNLTSISWGAVSPGESVDRTVYVKNTGNAPITLSMTTSGWSPAAANGPITISWNKEGTVLNAGQSTAATITLSTSSGISGITDFSVNIIVTGSG